MLGGGIGVLIDLVQAVASYFHMLFFTHWLTAEGPGVTRSNHHPESIHDPRAIGLPFRLKFASNFKSRVCICSFSSTLSLQLCNHTVPLSRRSYRTRSTGCKGARSTAVVECPEIKLLLCLFDVDRPVSSVSRRTIMKDSCKRCSKPSSGPTTIRQYLHQ